MLYQIKNFCDSKSTIKKVKRQSTEWEKYLEIIHIFDKRLVFRIYKEHLQ